MNLPDNDGAARPALATNESIPERLPFAKTASCLSLIEQSLAAFFLFLIVSTMGAQVFARYFFGAPFSWSEEVARMALIWMTFIAAAFVMAEGRHITVDLISHRLSIKGQVRLECFSHLVVAVSCLLLLVGGSRFVWYVGKVGSPSLGIPMSWWYGAVDVGLLLMTLHSVVNLMQVIATGHPTEQAGLVEEGFQLELERGE